VGVVSALTVQDTAGVRQVHPLPAEVIGEQLVALLSDVEVASGKLGMLGDDQIAAAVADALGLTRAPIVWDPVLVSSQGSVPLYRGDPRQAARRLAPHIAIATPNLREAEVLCGDGIAVTDVAGMERAAARIAGEFGFSVLVTGGHLAGQEIVDVLAVGETLARLPGDRVAGPSAHGTGCALSTVLACELARGSSVDLAATRAAAEVRRRLRDPARPGRGLPAVM
jgi:hydroxymethylpyrimidine/phosphomethylpyrimidine kinase